MMSRVSHVSKDSSYFATCMACPLLRITRALCIVSNVLVFIAVIIVNNIDSKYRKENENLYY